MNQLLEFYKDKKVLVTGHTGFKGSWICEVLLLAGAKVCGFALHPDTTPNLYELCDLEHRMQSYIGDVRDLDALRNVFDKEQPEIVIHMAAQPIVRESYKDPVGTYATNVMGTVHVMECVRQYSCVKSVINVTTDKVYKNKEWEWGYRENEELNGYDPYSNSKSCSELVTDSYRNSFFQDEIHKVAISTMRAGNVIGGGDFACDRIIPDCVRAANNGADIILRNPYAIRPFQHVLEPVVAYLYVAKEQYNHIEKASAYNIGPDEVDCVNVEALTQLFCNAWSALTGKYVGWQIKYDGGPHEANYLKLDCSKVKKTFNWRAVWNIRQAIEKSVELYWAISEQNNIQECMQKQIREYLQIR